MDKTLFRPVFGIVLIAVALLMFPMIITGAEGIRTHASVANYTGLSSIITIVPVLAMVGLLFTGGFLFYTGIKKRSASRKSKSKGGRVRI